MNSVPTGFSAVPPVCPPATHSSVATDPVRAWPSDRRVSVRNGQRRPHGVVPTHTLFPRGSAPWERQVQRGLARLWFPVLVPGPLSVQRWTALGSWDGAHSRSRRSLSISDKHTLARKEGKGVPDGSVTRTLTRQRRASLGSPPESCLHPLSAVPLAVPSVGCQQTASPFSQTRMSEAETQEGNGSRNDPVTEF